MKNEIEIQKGCEAKIVGNKVVFVPKESEDERVREILIHIVKGACCKYGIKYIGDDITEEKLLAYLERQKEYIDDIRQYAYNKGLVDAEEKQKPAEWSEEDENVLKYLHELISFGFTEKFFDAQTAADMREWLNTRIKSTRPQPKQEWSEEDEKMRNVAIEFVRQNNSFDFILGIDKDFVIDWLVSIHQKTSDGEQDKRITELKTFLARCNGFNRANREKAFKMIDSIRPRPNWKPSEEQMDALDSAINYLTEHTCTPGNPLLISLYNDLKKLTHE